MKSYVAVRLRPVSRIQEAWNLYVSKTRNVREIVRLSLEDARRIDMQIGAIIGKPVSGLKMLEIGPGQHLLYQAHFARRNDVLGIDLDEIVQHFNVHAWLRMAQRNGWVRVWKTAGRKIAGIDRAIRSELLSQLAMGRMPELRVLQMDAARMDLPDNEFDVVFSRAVFEHLPDPGAVICEIRRVLKPGGMMFVLLHLFSSDSGCHDTRIFAGRRGKLPFWAHLRPEHEHAVRQSSYLNKLRLFDWRKTFEARMPGANVAPLCDAGDVERQQLFRLRSQGQLMEYSDEELLSTTVQVTWQKPHDSALPRDSNRLFCQPNRIALPLGCSPTRPPVLATPIGHRSAP